MVGRAIDKQGYLAIDRAAVGMQTWSGPFRRLAMVLYGSSASRLHRRASIEPGKDESKIYINTRTIPQLLLIGDVASDPRLLSHEIGCSRYSRSACMA